MIDTVYGGKVKAHRTFSVASVDGRYPPLSSDANWLANTEQRPLARVFLDLVVRGTTALTDAPTLELVPYLRQMDEDGTRQVCGGDSVYALRKTLADNTAIKFQKTTDNGASYTDYSANVIDNSAATQADLDALDTSANGDWFVAGGPVPFTGMAFDMDAANVNANASVLTMEYWNGAWTALSNMTDGTVSAGKTLAQDGQITWSLPTDWVASTINAISAYWVRGRVSAALSANVDVEECDLLEVLKTGFDVGVQGHDLLVTIAAATGYSGTLAISGAIRVAWL